MLWCIQCEDEFSPVENSDGEFCSHACEDEFAAVQDRLWIADHYDA